MKNINEIELNMLNDKKKASIIGTIGKAIYYIIKGILETVYIITCIICTTIEVISYILTIGTATRTIHKRRRKRWY